MRLVVVSLAALMAASATLPVSAETLAESMTSAVEGNPTLAAQRQRLNATREALPQAIAQALPVTVKMWRGIAQAGAFA